MVSDQRVLFLLLGGVGATAALQHTFWGPPGDLPSPRKDMDCAWSPNKMRGKKDTKKGRDDSLTFTLRGWLREWESDG